MATGPIFEPVDDASAAKPARPEGAMRGPNREPERAPDLLDVVIGLDQQINTLTALRARAIELARRESERGTRPGSSSLLSERSFRAELATALHISERSAENLIGNAAVLVDAFPATLAALEAGRISYRHATVLIDELAGLTADDRTALEPALVVRATASTPSRLRVAARLAREQHNPESIEERQVAARANRGVGLTDGPDGMSTLFVELASPNAHAIFNRLTTAAKALQAPGDPRSLDNRRADILTAVLLADDGGMPFGVIPGEADSEEFARWFRGITAEVIVSVPVLTLLGRSDLPATLDGVVPIDPETARILAGNAKSLVRILTHPETGTTLSVGRKRYKVPKDLRMYLKIRDRVCRFPGCSQPAARCDLDHTVDWQYFGQTDHANLAYLCRGHHTLKGETSWNVSQRSDASGQLIWVSPTGRRYTTEPGTRIAS